MSPRSAVLLALLAACTEDERGPPSARGVGAPVAVEAPAEPETMMVPRFGSASSSLGGRAAAGPATTAAAPTPSTAEEGETGPSEAERALSAELVAALGDAASCGGFGPVTPRTLQLSASVTSSGRVNQASVTGEMPEETRSCLVARIEHHVFSGPIPSGSRTLHAAVQLRGSEGPTTTEREAVSPELRPLTNEQRWIAGPSGTMISAPGEPRAIGGPSGAAISGAGGTATISGPSGTMIAGPSGVPIGSP